MDLTRQEQLAKIAVSYAGLLVPVAILFATHMVNSGAEARAAQEKCIDESIQLLDKQYSATDLAPTVADERRSRFATVAAYTVQYCDRAGFSLPQVVTSTIAREQAAAKGTAAGESLARTTEAADDITEGPDQAPAPAPPGPTAPKPAPNGQIRLFLQIVDESQRPAARQLEQRLEGASFGGRRIVVPGIEKVASGGDNSLRCLKVSDCAQARSLAAFVNGQLAAPQVTVTDLSARFDKAVTVAPGTFELWFGQGELRLK